MVTWQMTSRDLKRSRSWPRYIWSSISQQLCEIHGRFILTTNRKPHLGNPVVTWTMMSRDPTVFLWWKFSTLIRSQGYSIKRHCQNCSKTLENCLFCTCALKYGKKQRNCQIPPKFRFGTRYRKSMSLRTTVTTDFRSEVEIIQFLCTSKENEPTWL